MTPSPTTRTWILTGSLENFRVNAERGFDLIGLKERRRRQAQEFEPGDEVAFQGQLRTVGEADARILRERIDAAAVAV